MLLLNKRFPFLQILFSTVILLMMQLSAASQSSAVDDLIERADRLEQTASILIRISTPLERSDESLASARIKIQGLLRDTNELSRNVDDLSDAISKRLAEIGAAPGKDEPAESAAVTELRDTLTKDRSRLAVAKSRIEGVVENAQEQVSKISQRRQNAFTKAILKKLISIGPFIQMRLNRSRLSMRQVKHCC